MLDAARADVQNHLIAAHAVHRDHARGRVGGEGLGNHGVDRQYELAAFGLRLSRVSVSVTQGRGLWISAFSLRPHHTPGRSSNARRNWASATLGFTTLNS